MLTVLQLTRQLSGDSHHAGHKTEMGAVLHLPVDSVVYDAALAPRALGLAHGSRASVYGATDPASFGWSESPSFELAAGVIHAASSDDARLVRCVGVMLERCAPPRCACSPGLAFILTRAAPLDLLV